MQSRRSVKRTSHRWKQNWRIRRKTFREWISSCRSWIGYLNIQELTPEILHEFVERILVHERSEGRKKKGLGRFLF